MSKEGYNRALEAAWDEFCDGLKGAAKTLFNEDAPDNELDRATGIQYLTRYLTKALEREVEYADALFPQLRLLQSPTSKNFGDNPDCTYLVARIDGGQTYRIVGNRGTARWVRINVSGSQGNVSLADDELITEWDGAFVVVLSPDEHPGNWIRTHPGISQVMIRQFFGSWEVETPMRARIERVDATDTWPGELTADLMIERLRSAVEWMLADMIRWPKYLDYYKDKGVNIFHQGSPEGALRSGVAGSQKASGRWVNFCRFDLSPGEALLVEFTPPDCSYWTFELNDYWMMSVDYRYHLSSLNYHYAVPEKDGTYRAVVSPTDSGLANWLDTAGHQTGLIINRWVDSGSDNPNPSCRVVSHEELTSMEGSRRDPAARREQLRKMRIGVDRRFGHAGR